MRRPNRPRCTGRLISSWDWASIHRIESLNVFVACAAPEPLHCPKFLICDCCGVAEEFSAEFVSTIPFAARGWFEVRHMIVEVHGTCAACREA